MPTLERHAGPVVELRDVTLRRSSGFRVEVPHLRVDPGETAAVVGPSGAGKSTLLAALLGLAPRDAGLSIEGLRLVLGDRAPSIEDPRWRARLSRDVGFVPQDARAALDPLRRVGEQIAEQAGGVPMAAVVDAMARLGVESPDALAKRPPHEVSGGQAQRALLALAMLRRPALLVLDEPTAGLDRARVHELIDELAALRRARPDLAMLVASHLTWFVEALGARPWSIEGGRLIEGAPPHEPWPRLAAGEGEDGEVVVAGRRLGVERGGHWILSECDVALHAGEAVALVGPSGAGKTTLGRVLAGHVRADAGHVERPHARRTDVQLVFQDAAGSLTPHRTVRSLCVESSRGAAVVEDLAQRFELPRDALDRRPRELSGGQQRRAALLRAVCASPKALILDEPTTGLDRSTAQRVTESLVGWLRERGAASLWITHDDELAASVADRLLTIQGGRLC